MTGCPPAAAVAAVIQALEHGAAGAVATAARYAVVGEPLFVERLDKAGRGYYLAKLVSPSAPPVVTQVDVPSCRIAKLAAIKADVPLLAIDERTAQRSFSAAVPGIKLQAPAWLGWQACAESCDSFLPLWVFETGEGRFFIDQGGRLHNRLTLPGRAG